MADDKVGRNDPCPCGSGKKYKRCCGAGVTTPGLPDERDGLDWGYFMFAIKDAYRRCLPGATDILPLVQKYDRFMGRLVSRSLAAYGERPQDLMACNLAVRAFRLTIGSLWLALSGYADLAPGLSRGIWEIGLRLMHAQKDPRAAALGTWLRDTCKERKTTLALSQHEKHAETRMAMEAFAQQKGLELDKLTRHAESLGYDANVIRKEFGAATIREVCDSLGILDAYEGSYAWYSDYTHNRNPVMDTFTERTQGERLFEAGPKYAEGWAVVAAYSFTHLATVAVEASRMVDDRALLREAVSLAKTVDSIVLSADARTRQTDGNRAK